MQASWWVVDWDEFEFEISLTPFMLQAAPGFEYPLSDENGELIAGPFPNEPPYRMGIFKPGYAMRTLRWNPEKDGDEVEVVLTGGGAVEGIVIDTKRSVPVTSFTVSGTDLIDQDVRTPSSFNPFSGGRLIESEKGRFAIEGVRAGTSNLSFTAPGYLPETVEIAVAEGEATRGVIVKLTPGGTVTGRVVDSQDEPVAGAQVVAVNEDGSPRIDFVDSPSLGANSYNAQASQRFGLELFEVVSGLGIRGPGAVFSGADGSFELTGLPSGPLRVLAQHRDHAPTRSDPLVLSEGEPLTDVVVKLKSGGGLYGVVEDLHGRTVPDVIVLAFSTAQFGGGGGGMELHLASQAFQGLSGPDGEYRIEHMQAGSYFLAAVRGDEALNPMSFLGTLNFDLVNVPAERMLRHDVLDTSSGACRVSGRVLSGGLPVRKGALIAMGFESDSLLGVDVKIAQVGDGGGYEFAGLAPGMYRFNYGGTEESANIEVEVPDLPEVVIDIELPSGEINGRVVDSSTGEPIARAEVILRPAEALEAGGVLGALISAEAQSERDWTDDDGDFYFAGLSPGKYFISAAPRTWGGGAGDYGPSDEQELELVKDEVLDDVEIRLDPTLEIRGVVLGEDLAPLSDVWVRAYDRELPELRVAVGRSADDGSFVLRGLAPGIYDVGAYASKHPATHMQEVTLGEDATPQLEFIVQTGVGVRVHVVGSDGAPVQGATGRMVSLEGPTLPDSVNAGQRIENLFRGGKGMSNADGDLDLGEFAPGRYRLEVVRGDQRGEIGEVQLTQGAP